MRPVRGEIEVTGQVVTPKGVALRLLGRDSHDGRWCAGTLLLPSDAVFALNEQIWQAQEEDAQDKMF